MTKLYRVIAYVLDLNGNVETMEDVIDQMENNRYPEFLRVEDIIETDIGEWDDDHELNKSSKDMKTYDKYFPELVVRSPSKLELEIQAVRSKLLTQNQENSKLQLKIEDLEEEITKLKKVKDFISTIDGIMK